jgi:hypothetical protein
VDDPNPDWLPAIVDANGNWVVPNAQLEPGVNRFTVRVTDGDDNVTTTSERNLTLRTEGQLTITGKAEGYAAGSPGRLARSPGRSSAGARRNSTYRSG